MAVKLEFLTSDLEEIELINRYWAMNEHGGFLEPLKELLPFRELKQPAQLAKYVRKLCIAYDLNHLCVCGNPMRADGRTDAKKVLRQSNYPCDQCAEARLREQQAREAAEKAELDLQLASHIDWMKRKTIVYQELEDDVVLVLRALYDAVGPRLWNGGFTYDSCSGLTPYNSGDFISELYGKGALGDAQEGTRPNTYFLSEGRLRIRLNQAKLFLPPDADMGNGEKIFDLMMERQFTNSEALINLWLDYACDDVIWYLMDQCDLHNREVLPEDFVKIRDAIRYGLRTHSVAQMWYIMWKVARDAAALSTRSYYSDHRATATIPGKIRKQLEMAEKKGELRNDWNRQQAHIAGTLGIVLREIFGIDEYSSGAAVHKMFERLDSQFKSEDRFEGIATAFMRDALDLNTSLPALEAFAEMIRSGLTTEDALIETVQRNPGILS
jgi:hypothetical protein